jgi:hypothetical protein
MTGQGGERLSKRGSCGGQTAINSGGFDTINNRRKGCATATNYDANEDCERKVFSQTP